MLGRKVWYTNIWYGSTRPFQMVPILNLSYAPKSLQSLKTSVFEISSVFYFKTLKPVAPEQMTPKIWYATIRQGLIRAFQRYPSESLALGLSPYRVK